MTDYRQQILQGVRELGLDPDAVPLVDDLLTIEPKHLARYRWERRNDSIERRTRLFRRRSHWFCFHAPGEASACGYQRPWEIAARCTSEDHALEMQRLARQLGDSGLREAVFMHAIYQDWDAVLMDEISAQPPGTHPIEDLRGKAAAERVWIRFETHLYVEARVRRARFEELSREETRRLRRLVRGEVARRTVDIVVYQAAKAPGSSHDASLARDDAFCAAWGVTAPL